MKTLTGIIIEGKPLLHWVIELYNVDLHRAGYIENSSELSAYMYIYHDDLVYRIKQTYYSGCFKPYLEFDGAYIIDETKTEWYLVPVAI